jgi:hypothetical protein
MIVESQMKNQPETLPQNMIFGENSRLAFRTTDSACLDLFSQVVPGTSVEDLRSMLQAAWNQNPEVALRIIFNIGNVRGGKQDRVNFYRALSWLFERYPSTFFLNIKEIPKHSCLKCLLNVLMFFTHPESERYSLEGSIRSLEERVQYMESLRFSKEERIEAKRGRQVQLRRGFALSLGRVEIKLSDGVSIDCELSLEQLRVMKNKGVEVEPCYEQSQIDILLHTEWISPTIRDKWLAFAKAVDEARAAAAKQLRRSTQAEVDADVRSRLQGTELEDPKQSTYVDDQDERTDDGTHRRDLLRRLYREVSDIFAQGIAEDLAASNRRVKSLSGLYAKWAPTPKGMHDKATRISEGIAERLHSAGLLELQLDKDLDPSVARSLKLDRMRKILSRLRGEAKVPEHFVGKGAWDQVDYNRMASRCRLIFGEKVFAKNDPVRYSEFLSRCAEAAAKGEKGPGVPTVKSGVLLPHEVTGRAESLQEEQTRTSEMLEAELQWKGLVDGCAASGAGQHLRMVPVCDVSGSMMGTPMEVAVALSLLLAESAPRVSPWYGTIITFSERPHLVEVPGIPQFALNAGDENTNVSQAESARAEMSAQKIFTSGVKRLAERVEFVKGMDWGTNTNVEAVFDLLLERLKSTAATREDAQRLAIVIFSDMEFDANVERDWETAHESIAAKFEAAGFGPPPLLVYWNLRSSKSIPVGSKDTPGVILLSGYSAGMLRTFLEGRLEDMTPEKQLLRIISTGIYNQLRVAEDDWPKGGSEMNTEARSS